MPKLNLNMWLSPEDVQPESRLTFINEGQHGTIPSEGDQPDKQTFEIGVELPNGEQRTWTMNKTSQRAVAQVYGTDTSKWVGKPVTVYVSQENVRGKLRNVVYARVPEPVEEKVSNTPAKPAPDTARSQSNTTSGQPDPGSRLNKGLFKPR